MSMVPAPICYGCKLFKKDSTPLSCKAFPTGIPDDILLSRFDHRDPYVGDQSLRFDPRTPQDADYAHMLFEY